MFAPTVLAIACTVGGAFGAAPKTTLAKYDDLQGVLASTPVQSPYKGLHYSGFNLAPNVDSLAPGNLQPASPPNIIYSAVNTELLNGIATITTPGVSFDLLTMRFGCFLAAEVVRQPTDCTIIASAIAKNGVRKSTTIKFTANTKMELVQFPIVFKGVKQVSFTLASVSPTEDDTAIGIDDLTYILHQLQIQSSIAERQSLGSRL